jgi:Rod binding domain-containing protein
MSADISGAAMTAVQSAQIRTPAATGSLAQIKKAAQDYEATFVTQMLGQMFQGISTDGPFGGGQGEQMFRSLMLDEYGKKIASQGGIGLADQVTKELLKHQEVAAAQAAAQAAPTKAGAIQ